MEANAMEICENPKKRPLSPSSSCSSSPPSSPPPERSFVSVTRSLVELLRKKAESYEAKCAGEIHVNFQASLYGLVRKGIVSDALYGLVRKGLITDPLRLRSEESVKESWDTGSMPPIIYDKLLSVRYKDHDRNMRRRVKAYLKSAAKTTYFEVLPEDRPDGMMEGFYRIYPEGQDTIFETHRNFKKFADLVPKLGVAAVETHNFMTGSGSQLKCSEVKKANLFFTTHRHYYFLTLEAEDEESGKTITCKSRVSCGDDDSEWHAMEFDETSAVVQFTMVESFELVK